MSKEEKKVEDGVNDNTVNQEQEVSENARLNDSFGQENVENVVESVELNPMEKLQADYN